MKAQSLLHRPVRSHAPDARLFLTSMCAAAFLLGCPSSSEGDQDSLVCSQDIRPGIDIEVRDSRTGAPAACGATAEISEGDYLETLDAASRCTGRDSRWPFIASGPVPAPRVRRPAPHLREDMPQPLHLLVLVEPD